MTRPATITQSYLATMAPIWRARKPRLCDRQKIIPRREHHGPPYYYQSTMTGKDNCAWYLFDQHSEGQTILIGRAA